MKDMLSAKELAAMVPLVLSRVPCSAEAHDEWILDRYAKEMFGALGELTPKMKDACWAELKNLIAADVTEAPAEKPVSATALEDGLGFTEEKPVCDESGQPDLRAVAERQLHYGYSYVHDEIRGQFGRRHRFAMEQHFRIFELIKLLLGESDRLYLDEQLKQCAAEAKRLTTEVNADERLRQPLDEFQQLETAALVDGDGRAAFDDLKGLLVKHGKDAMVVALTPLIDIVMKNEPKVQYPDEAF